MARPGTRSGRAPAGATEVQRHRRRSCRTPGLAAVRNIAEGAAQLAGLLDQHAGDLRHPFGAVTDLGDGDAEVQEDRAVRTEHRRADPDRAGNFLTERVGVAALTDGVD